MSEQVSHTEAVLAFIYETKQWRDMETDERLAWCQRVAHVLSGAADEQFGEWTQAALAPVLGISQSAISQRLTWSERYFAGDRNKAVDVRGRTTGMQVGDAKRAFNNPNISAAAKKDLISELADTPSGRKALIEAIAEDEELVRYINRRTDAIHPSSFRPKQRLEVDEWEQWTAAQQEEFDSKTVKSARHLLIAAWLRSQGYVSSGEAEMLLSLLRPSDLDSELADLVRDAGLR